MSLVSAILTEMVVVAFRFITLMLLAPFSHIPSSPTHKFLLKDLGFFHPDIRLKSKAWGLAQSVEWQAGQ
jgi:hypothetical protein